MHCDDSRDCRRRAAVIRIANALMKEQANPADAGGDVLAAALERIAVWCESANEFWDKMTEGE